MSTDSTEAIEQTHDASVLDDAVALAVTTASAVSLSPEGELVELNRNDAVHTLAARPVVVCHRILTARRLDEQAPPRRRTLYDVLELFAFVRPAEFCVPTPAGIAAALDLPPPTGLEECAEAIQSSAHALLHELTRLDRDEAADVYAIARDMERAGWSWAPAVLSSLPVHSDNQRNTLTTLQNMLLRLPEWEELAPPGAAGSEPVLPEEVDGRLNQLLQGGRGAELTEQRDQQIGYAQSVAEVFAPRARAGEPHIVLAEAGTGIGKTLGYLSPASLWAEKNGPGLWISTYTKNLQRQIDQEINRLFPDRDVKAKRAVIRKGRENYLCLLNLQERAGGFDAVALGLLSRWAAASRDGDMVGGDFPAWLGALVAGARSASFGPDRSTLGAGLTDRRGECIYSACPHYKKCFIEKAVRKSRHADLVVANHALVMIQAALEQATDDRPSNTGNAEPQTEKHPARPYAGPARLIFDEGHHLFDAADSAFSAHLTGQEAAELRRWIRGPEERRQRGRSLEDRIGDLIDGMPEATSALKALRRAALILPGAGWANRLATEQPAGPMEDFLALVHQQVMARSEGASSTSYDQECSPWPAGDGVLESAHILEDALGEIARPFTKLARLLRELLDDQAAELDSQTKGRIDAIARGLERRAQLQLPAWQKMLQRLPDGAEESFVDWFSIQRAFGRLYDLGMHRHWIDPTIPFARAVIEPAHGVLVTSATLRDVVPDDGKAADEDTPPADWQSAEIRTGAIHLPLPATRRYFASPFDYGNQTEIVVVNDVPRNDERAVAAAYRELFVASGGGALGLFTAIKRLRNVHELISEDLDAAGLMLYAQHIDPIDTGSLVDMFRAEENSCLLGTDAVRDGVDVPGQALRLIVFDRVPWPRPDILHKARKKHFGGTRYDDLITRLRLKQAYGRLIRRHDDRGMFVMLDSRTPTRLTTAFPETVQVKRLGLKDTVEFVTQFFADSNKVET